MERLGFNRADKQGKSKHKGVMSEGCLKICFIL